MRSRRGAYPGTGAGEADGHGPAGVPCRCLRSRAERPGLHLRPVHRRRLRPDRRSAPEPPVLRSFPAVPQAGLLVDRAVPRRSRSAGTGPQGTRGLRAGGVPAWKVGPERAVPQALRLLEAGRATRPVRLGGARPDPREPRAGRVPAAVLRSVGRQPHETVLRRPLRPLGPAWPARSRTLHRRLRVGRHRPHRPARAARAAEAGIPVRAAMPLRRPLPGRPCPAWSRPPSGSSQRWASPRCWS